MIRDLGVAPSHDKYLIRHEQAGGRMLFSDWRVLTRRWYIVLSGILITAAMCVATFLVFPASYEATASILLMPPQVSAREVGGNPFLAMGNLGTVSNVLAKTMSDRTTQEAVEDQGGTGKFTIAPDPATAAPVLVVTVQDSTPGGVLKTLDVVTSRLPTVLKDLQTTSRVPANSLIWSKEITRDTLPQKLMKPVVRALLAVGALGLGGALLSAALLDGLLGRRRRAGGVTAQKASDPEHDVVVETRSSTLVSQWPGPRSMEVDEDLDEPLQLEALLGTKDVHGTRRTPG